MSLKGTIKIECPHCGEQFEADVWTVVRGDKDFDLKEMIITGEFDLFMCPFCSTIFSHEETFVYFDREMEILAFVLPEKYANEKEKYLKKMNEDYCLVKDSFTRDRYFPLEPAVFFGMDKLMELLLKDTDIREETDVMEVLAKNFKLRIKKIHPEFARSNDLLFSIPCVADKWSRKTVLQALNKIHSENDALPRVKRLIKIVESMKSDEELLEKCK
jgi:uncharacterized Zn-finger protein